MFHALRSLTPYACSGAPLSFSLTPSMQTSLFLIFQFLGLHDNKIIPCRKHWSGSEGNTKGSAHKASQCSQCNLLRRQTTLLYISAVFILEPFDFKSSPLYLHDFFLIYRIFLKQRSNKRTERAHQPSRSSEGWRGLMRNTMTWRKRENEETQRIKTASAKPQHHTLRTSFTHSSPFTPATLTSDILYMWT